MRFIDCQCHQQFIAISRFKNGVNLSRLNTENKFNPLFIGEFHLKYEMCNSVLCSSTANEKSVYKHKLNKIF